MVGMEMLQFPKIQFGLFPDIQIPFHSGFDSKFIHEPNVSKNTAILIFISIHYGCYSNPFRF